MTFKFHIPTQSYGFLEISGNASELKEAEQLYNKYAETPIKFKDGEITKTIELQSFTENIVADFDPVGHRYSYKGKPLMGATTFLKKFVKEFDSRAIAQTCEKSWGIPAAEIESLWEGNKNLATDFGSVVHKALEHYFESKDAGFDDDKAMPKHPILKGIITSFLEASTKDKGKIMSEVFVTDIKNDRCGQIDRLLVLDEKKKICRIQDYKVNVGSEEVSNKNKLLAPYDKLPANKLSKYQLQLNYYAQILESAGWTVQGLDVYVYEDEWKIYTLDRISI